MRPSERLRKLAVLELGQKEFLEAGDVVLGVEEAGQLLHLRLLENLVAVELEDVDEVARGAERVHSVEGAGAGQREDSSNAGAPDAVEYLVEWLLDLGAQVVQFGGEQQPSHPPAVQAQPHPVEILLLSALLRQELKGLRLEQGGAGEGVGRDDLAEPRGNGLV